MAKRSPILGYNHNIGHRGLVFHVQTEDSGVDNPHVFTHLFHGGVIITTRRLDYDPSSAEDAVKGLMQAQHKSVLKDLNHGLFTEKIDSYLGGNPDLLPFEGDEGDEPAAIAAPAEAVPAPAPAEPTPAPAEPAPAPAEPAEPAEPAPEPTPAAAAPPPTPVAPSPDPAAPRVPMPTPPPGVAKVTFRSPDVDPRAARPTDVDPRALRATEPVAPYTDPAPVDARAARPTDVDPRVLEAADPDTDPFVKHDLDEPPSGVSNVSAAFDAIVAAEEPVEISEGVAEIHSPAPPSAPVPPGAQSSRGSYSQHRLATRPPHPGQAPQPYQPAHPPPPPRAEIIDERPTGRVSRVARPPATPPPRPPPSPPPRPPVRPSGPAPDARPPSPPPRPPAKKSGVVVSRPAVIVGAPPTVVSGTTSTKTPARASRPRKATKPKQDGLFGQGLISEKSLDEVILAYLSDDSAEE